MPKPGKMGISAISHVSMCVRDLDKTIKFYSGLLGFEVTRDEFQDTSTGGMPHLYRDGHKQRRLVYMRYAGRDSAPFLVFTEHPGDKIGGAPIMLDEVGISHISFTVPDVTALADKLMAAGVPTCGPKEAFPDKSGHMRTVFFRDPDGVIVQFDGGGEG